MALIPRRFCAQAPASASAAAGESQGTEVGGDEEDESPSKSIFAWASGGGLSQSGAAGGAQVRTAPAASRSACVGFKLCSNANMSTLCFVQSAEEEEDSDSEGVSLTQLPFGGRQQ